MEPSVLINRLGSLLGLLVIALDNCGASEADFPTRAPLPLLVLVGGEVVHVGDVDELELHCGGGSSDVPGVRVICTLTE